MTKLFKTKKEGSKYAWAAIGGNGFVLNHEDAAMYQELGLLRVSASGATALLLVDIQLQAAINPETKASVGNRVIGFTGSLADSLILLNAQQQAVKANRQLTAEQAAASI